MTRILTALVVLGLPVTVSAQDLSREQLLELAAERGVCGERSPIDARYDDDGRILVTCGEATGFVPAIGALGVGAGAAAAAGIALLGAAGGGGGSAPPSTD